MMKWLIVIMSILVLAGCAGPAGVGSRSTGNNIIMEQQDENEYAIIIDDPQFNSWLISHGHPTGFYSNDYYRNRNHRLVSEWNSRFHARSGRSPYTFNINYDYNTDYGFDVNYQLFHYFKFMSQKYRINLPGV
jgi:hypothetical protein